MPELPEVETILRGLRALLPGRVVTRARVLKEDLVTGSPRAFRAQVTRARFESVARRGKNLLLHMESLASSRSGSTPSFTIVVNLGMSGRVLLRGPGTADPEPTHPGVRLALDDGGELVYHDPRRFGRLGIRRPGELEEWSRSLGPEPLGRAFTPKSLAAGMARSSAPIRSWLLDQRRVAGVGNIYANEALFLAGVHPEAPARSVDPVRMERLHGALRLVLSEAIRARGTTLRDYRTAQGWEGGYRGKLRVYGREGEPCPACETTVTRVSFGGRSAFLCPACQPRRTA
jgi:formamidopyrimidine-DNA glycosylase